MVAYETIHAMKNKRKGRKGWLAIKLYMSKAYDRVEWAYLEGVMARLGFSSKWIKLIMSCVTTVTYSTVINGKQCGFLVPSKGQRQRDPLSPYLFLLCAEGLVGLMRNTRREGTIQRVVSKKAPKVSHLFFADDSMFFCHAKRTDCMKVMEILAIYRQASRQEVN